MNKLDIGAMAENIFSHVNLYINRYMEDMKKYVDGQIGTAKEHTDQLEERLLKLRVEASTHIENRPPAPADDGAALAGKVEEIEKLVKNCERRATRQADHLLNLQASVRKLQGKEEA
jgi:hypothetical protein